MPARLKFGDRVSIRVPAGQRWDRAAGKLVTEWSVRTGRVVIVNADGTAALNMGGRHGTPGLATADNIVRVVSRSS